MSEALVVMFTAMVPIGELRVAIPLGLIGYDLGWPLALSLGVVGNLIPLPFVLAALYTIGERLERRDDFVGRILRWRTERIQRALADRVARYGFWAVMLFVAIPLPLTGAWTGALAVWALRLNARMGLAAIAAGVLIAGIIVTSLTLAGIGIVSITD